MAKNNVQLAKVLIESIEELINSKLGNLRLNRKKKAVIQSLNVDGTVNLTIDGEKYNDVKVRAGLVPQVGEVVFVEIPNNQFKDMFVDTAKILISTDEESNHTHNNLSVLQTITQTLINKWDTVTSKADKTYVDTGLGNKVDKITGKGLSTEDYTSGEKTKLSGIENGANKYTHPSTHSLDIITETTTKKIMTSSERDKLTGISSGANKVENSSTNGNIKIDGVERAIYTHPTGTNPHGTTKSDLNLGNVENKSSSTIRSEITSINVTNALGFTPESTLNKGKANGYAPLDSNIKIPLSILPDIAKQQTYVVGTLVDRSNLTNLIMGEKCYVTSTGDSYIWDGDSWEILAKADWENVNLQWTNIVGKPSSNVSDIDNAVSIRHTHGNKGIIDSITQALIDRWNSAWTHISDTIKHITSVERSKWNTVENKADKVYVDSELDKKSNEEHKHIESDITDLDKYTKVETDAKLNTKVDKVTGKQLSTNDYTTLEKSKLENIEAGANKYILPTASKQNLGGIKVGANLIILEDGTLNAIADDSRSTFVVKQETFVAAEGQKVFNLTTGNYQPNTFTISFHLYGNKQPNIAFSETSPTSFMSNKPLEEGDVLLVEYIEISSAEPYPIHGSDHLTDGYDPIPKVTTTVDGLMAKEDKAKLNGIAIGANNYTHPSTHPASMITESTTKRFVSDSERSTWNAKETPTGAQTKANTSLNDAKAYTDIHDADAVKHITAVERTKWNAIDNKADKSYVDNIEIGGRNYFSNSDFREGIDAYWERLNSSPASNFEVVNSELKVIFNAGTKSDFGTMNFISQNNLEGQDYITVSSLVRGSGTLRIRFGASTMPMQTINNTQFKRVFFTIPRSNFGNGNLIIEVASGTLYFYKIKAETGNKATDWTPSPEEIEGLIDSKADKSQVLTNVPLNAKFTDTNTTYSEITTAEIDAGTSATPRTITGRRVKYILDKVTSIINNLTKSNVGLSNVDNTSDLSKPISTATQTALNGKVDNNQVLTNVPSGAKFTDTITTVNNKTGAISKADIVALGIPSENTTYGLATTAIDGLMSKSDKVNLNSNTSARHTHTQKDVLDKLTDSDGKLLYNGELISGDYNQLANKPLDDNFYGLGVTYSALGEDELLIYQQSTSSYKKINKEDFLSDASSSDYVLIIKRESFISTLNQTLFTLTQGEYVPNNSRVKLYIGGLLQPDDSFVETSPTNITLKHPIDSGADVVIEYIQLSSVMDYVHAQSHKTGGSDPITPQDIGAEPSFNKNTAFNKNFGTTAGTVCQGNDSRLSNARVPLAHDHNEIYYTESEVNALLTGKVDSSQVLTDVPLNAKFTDTIYTHPTTAGNKHIPTGGAANQILRYSASGTAVWSNETNTTYTAGLGLLLTGTVFTPVFGTTANTITQGNDSRLSDAREPLAHDHQALYYDKSYIDTQLSNKVDSSQVLTNVPLNAKFTDTNTITTVNGKTGAISKADIVALGIPAQDTVYTHPTASGNKHIPSGGASGQFLKWSSNGTAIWDTVPGGLTLGESSVNAYRGDRGKVAYDHSQISGNPHNTTKSNVGLGSVQNYGIATQSEAEAGTSNAKYMTPLRTREAIDSNSPWHKGVNPPSNRNLFWIDTR